MLLDIIPPDPLPEYDAYTEMTEIPPAVITLSATSSASMSSSSTGPDMGSLVPDNNELYGRLDTKLPDDDAWLDIPLRIRDQRSLTTDVYGEGSELGRVYVDANTVVRRGLPLLSKYIVDRERGESCSVWWSPAVICSLTEFGVITKRDPKNPARVVKSACSDYMKSKSSDGDLPQMTLRVYEPTPVEGEAGRNVYYLCTDGSGQTFPLFTDRQGDGVMSADLKPRGGYWLHEETPSWQVAESCAVMLRVGEVEFSWRGSKLEDGGTGDFGIGGSLVVANWQSGVVTVVDDD